MNDLFVWFLIGSNLFWIISHFSRMSKYKEMVDTEAKMRVNIKGMAEEGFDFKFKEFSVKLNSQGHLFIHAWSEDALSKKIRDISREN